MRFEVLITKQELSGCFSPAMVIPVTVVNEGLPVAGIGMRYRNIYGKIGQCLLMLLSLWHEPKSMVAALPFSY